MGKWSFLRNSNYRRTVKSILLIKTFFGLVEMMFGLVNVSFSLPEWQAVKMTFFALHPETTNLWIRPTFCKVTTGFRCKTISDEKEQKFHTAWQTPFHGGSSGSITISGYKTTKCWQPPLVSNHDLGRELTTNSTHMWQVPSLILHLCTEPFFYVIVIIVKFIYLFSPKRIMSHRSFSVDSLVVWLSSAYQLQ